MREESAQSALSEKLANTHLIDAAMKRAVREAVLTHAKAGNPVATWRDGKLVWLQAEEVFRLLGLEGQET